MASDLYSKTGKFASMIDAPEKSGNEATMKAGLYKATTQKAESTARTTAEQTGGFGTQYVKPGRKDR